MLVRIVSMRSELLEKLVAWKGIACETPSVRPRPATTTATSDHDHDHDHDRDRDRDRDERPRPRPRPVVVAVACRRSPVANGAQAATHGRNQRSAGLIGPGALG
jgi:hypothetical protein